MSTHAEPLLEKLFMRASSTPDSDRSVPLSGFARLLLGWKFLRVTSGVYLVLTLLVWGFLLALWLGSTGGRDRDGDVIGSDFRAFYTAGWMVRHGQSTRLYDFEQQQEVQRQLDIQPGAHRARGVSAYLNPPHFATAMAGLARLPYAAAFTAWTLATLAAFCASIGLMRPFLPSLHGPRGWLLMALALGFMPVYFTLSGGQNTAFSLLLFTLIFLALQKGRDWLAGVLIAVGLFKPQLFLGLLPLLALGKKPRALLGFLIGASLVWVWTVETCGTHALGDWLATVRSPFYQQNVVRLSYNMFSWQAFWRLLLGVNTLSSLVGWSFALATFGALCVLWHRFATTTTKDADANDQLLNLYALTVGGTVLMVPHLFAYDLALLVLPGLVLTDRTVRLPLEHGIALRLCLLAFFVAVIINDHARTTHLQFATPLLMIVLILAWRLTMQNGTQTTPALEPRPT